MKWIGTFALALAIIVSGCSRVTPEQDVINDALAALGGDRIANAKTLFIEGDGVQYNLGQDVLPGERTQTFAIAGYTRAIDVGGGRMRVVQTRTPNFTYYAGQQPQRQTTGLDGDVAYSIGANGTASRSPEATAVDQRMEFHHHPVTLLHAARQPGAAVANARAAGGERLVDITTAGGAVLTLAIDEATSRPSRVTSRAYHPNLGDVVVETRFDDYQDVNGTTLPTRLTNAVDDFVTAEMRVTRQALDDEVGDLAAPAAAASASAARPAPVVVVEELAPGVWYLTGGGHHSVVAEFKDSLMLIEAPQSEARAQAVIAKARELRPGKPLTHVVNTHHHFDHTAGIRAAIAEGLTVVTQSGNAAFFEEIARRPHTLDPDALARKPVALKLDAVADSRTFDDGTMTVTVYHVAGNPHTQSMLMAHLPRQRLLVEVDAFTPGSTVSPYSPNLLENIRTRNLRIDRVVPLHSTIAPLSQLVQVATANQAR